MARTVYRPIKVPRDQALARAEVCYDAPLRDSGLERICLCLNTLYEQKRGQLVCDWDAGGKICTPMQPAYWYCPILGDGSSTTDAILPAIYTNAGNYGFTMTITGAAGAAVWNNFAGAAGWRAPDVNTLTALDTIGATDYQEVILTMAGDMGLVPAFGVSVGYARAKAALDSTFGLATPYYPGNLVTPLDSLWVGTGMPLSVARLDDARHMARNLFASRLGPIITKARTKYDMMDPRSDYMIRSSVAWDVEWPRLEWSVDVPQGLTGMGASADVASWLNDDIQTYTARYWARASDTCTPGMQVRITGPQNSVTIAAPLMPGPYLMGPFDLTVRASREQADAPQLLRFFADDADSGSGCDLVSLSGYWRIPAIGGR